MKKFISILIFSFILYPSSFILLYAGIPERITYQGTLRKDGAIYTGTVSMEFKITSQDGSAIYWASGSTDVYVSAGLFRYPLGTPNESWFQSIKWYEIDPYVEVTIEGNSLPKDPLFASPYSMHSKTSQASFGDFTVTNGNVIISTTTGVGGIRFQDGSYQVTAAGSGVWGTYSPNIYWTGFGSVGIGTSNPSYKLEVLGVIRSTDSAYFATSQGNVGIGTTNTTERLEVSGNVKATAFQGDGASFTNLSVSSITVSGSLGAALDAGNYNITNLANPVNDQDAATKDYVNSLTGGGQSAAVLTATQTFTGQNTFLSQISVSSNLFINSGNFGIGTTQPQARFHINDSSANIKFTNGASAIGDMGQASGIITGAADDTFGIKGESAVLFSVGGPEHVRIDGNGNVGIGTTGPEKLLHISTSASGPTNDMLWLQSTTLGSGNTAGLAFLTYSGNTPVVRIQAINDTSFGGHLAFQTKNMGGSIAESVRITGIGSVGIGTTDPSSALDVAAGRIRVSSNTAPSLGSGVEIGYDSTGPGGSVIAYNRTGSAYLPLFVAGSTAKFYSGSAGKGIDIDASGNVGVGTDTPKGLFHVGYATMVVTTSGNVGIGTTDPGYKLDVVNTIRSSDLIMADRAQDANATVTWFDDTAAGYTRFLSNANKDLRLQAGGITGNLTFLTNSAEQMRINNNGNIGIGTTGPGSRFEVVGGSSTFRGSDSNSAIAGFTDASGNYRVMISTSGNVGIGTTGPSKELDVVGQVTIHPSGTIPDNIYNGNLIITKSAASGQYINLIRSGNYPWSIGTVYNTSNFAIGYGQGTDSSFTSPYFVIEAGTGNVGIGTTTPVGLFVVGNGTMTVQSTGNVGIGTTSPGGKLEVNGGIRLNTVTARPTCDSTYRGTLWLTQGGALVKDALEVCAKDATDVYAWRTIY